MLKLATLLPRTEAEFISWCGAGVNAQSIYFRSMPLQKGVKNLFLIYRTEHED
jgi:hypothetical protein